MKAFIIDGGYGKYEAIPVNIYDDKGNEVVDVMEAGYSLLGDDDNKLFIVERNGFLLHTFPSMDMLNCELEDVVADALKKDGFYRDNPDDEDKANEYRLIILDV